jgi:hypothetical protein
MKAPPRGYAKVRRLFFEYQSCYQVPTVSLALDLWQHAEAHATDTDLAPATIRRTMEYIYPWLKKRKVSA